MNGAFEAPRTERQERVVANLAHAQRIADALSPDPRAWEYRGEMADAGPGARAACACGHPIRYIFYVERDADVERGIPAKKVPIGSVCIEKTIPWLLTAGAEHLAERLREAMLALQEQIAEAKRRERDALAEEEMAALVEYRAALVEWRRDRLADVRGRWVPDGLYRGLKKFRVAKTPAASASAARTVLASYIEYVIAFSEYRSSVPRPTDAKLVAKLRKKWEEDERRAHERIQRNPDSMFADSYRADVMRAAAYLEWLS